MLARGFRSLALWLRLLAWRFGAALFTSFLAAFFAAFFAAFRTFTTTNVVVAPLFVSLLYVAAFRSVTLLVVTTLCGAAFLVIVVCGRTRGRAGTVVVAATTIACAGKRTGKDVA